MHPIRLVSLVVATLALLMASACGESAPEAPPKPAQAPGADDDGPRIAVLSPALAIIMRDLGIADRIVGRHGFDMVLDPDVPVVGDETGINYEVLLGVHPTHIVMERGAKGVPPRLEELARSNHWTIVDLPMLSLRDVERAVPALARIVGSAEALSRAAALDDELLASWGRSDAVARTLGRTVILASTEPIGVMGPGSFHYELLARMGAAPTPKAGAPYITLSREDLVRLNPRSIVLLCPGATEDARTLLGGLADLPIDAVEHERVIVVRDPLAQTPSTALVGVAREIAEACAPRDAGAAK